MCNLEETWLDRVLPLEQKDCLFSHDFLGFKMIICQLVGKCRQHLSMHPIVRRVKIKQREKEKTCVCVCMEIYMCSLRRSNICRSSSSRNRKDDSPTTGLIQLLQRFKTYFIVIIFSLIFPMKNHSSNKI